MEFAEQQDDIISEFIKISSSVSAFLEAHNDIAVSSLSDAFQERVHLILIRTGEMYVVCSKNNIKMIKSIVINEPMQLSHSPQVRSWLTKNSASWLTFTKSLIEEYTCAFYTETDFSKTYVFVAPHDSESVSAKVSDFLQFSQPKTLPENKKSEESSVVVYKPFVDYLKKNKEMAAILESGRPSSPGASFIKIDVSKESLEILKSKLETVTSQSILLNASQAKFFNICRDEILSDIHRQYLVIGNVFESDVPMNSQILTARTDLICLVCSETACCPVDNYINLKCNSSFTQTGDMATDETIPDVKIRKYKTWNQSFNQKLVVELSLKQMGDWPVNFCSVLERCFQILNQEFSSKITGIHLQFQNLRIINKFCSDLVETLQALDQNSPYNSSDKCIIVMVDTPEIQEIITESLTELINQARKRIQDNILHGAIPKTLSRLPKEIHKEKPVLWVQLSDFSGTPENLKLSADTLMNKLTMMEENHMATHVRIHRYKLESLLFFYEKEITELVPDIMDQFEESEEYIIPIVFRKDSQSSIQQIFKKLLKKILKKHIDVQSIQNETLLNSIVSECNQKFSNVKCNYKEEKSEIFLESLKLEDLAETEKHIKDKLGLLPDQKKLSVEELSGGIGAAFDLDIPNSFTYKVLKSDILSVDAEAIVCPISCSQTQFTHIGNLVLTHAGSKVRKEVMAHYNQYPNKMLPEGKVIFTSGGNLKYKLIIYVCCPTYVYSKGDDNIKEILVQAINYVLSIAETHELQSVAIPTIGAGMFLLPFDLCLESTLSGIEYFMNHTSAQHLKVINFIDHQKDSCLLIMNYLNIYLIPFQHNLTKTEDSINSLIDMFQHQDILPNSLDFIPDLTHNEIRTRRLQEKIPDSIPDLTLNEIRTKRLQRLIPDSIPEPTLNEIKTRRLQEKIADSIPDLTHDEIRTRLQPKIPDSIPDLTLNEIRTKRLQRLIPDSIPDPTLNEIKTRRLQEKIPDSIPDPTLNEIRTRLQQNISDYNLYPTLKEIRRQQTIPNLVPCPVCFKQVTKPRKFDCKHEYCSDCIADYLEVIGKMCPVCLNMKPQPLGEMLVELSETCLPGFEEVPSFSITYNIPNGIQQIIHPHPGQMYTGLKTKAYLPATKEGSCILKMLQKAFEDNLIFTIGDSLSQGKTDTVVWNGILHKTNIYGGPSVYGYPDPSYLSNVLAQLMEVGITPKSVESESIKDKIRIAAI